MIKCEGQTLRERGNNKIRQKSAISAVALSWRHRAAFWGNAANVLFAPSPYGFLLALLIHVALSCAASCGAFGATVRTSCSHPLPLPLCRFFGAVCLAGFSQLLSLLRLTRLTALTVRTRLPSRCYFALNFSALLLCHSYLHRKNYPPTASEPLLSSSQ